MLTPNIRNSKYTPGPLPAICAGRDALIALLSQAAAKRLIYISAPAGSGKTVSALLWMRSSGRKTVWVGLDALDNSTAVFYRMFCTAVLSAQPDNERMTQILHSPAFDASPVEHTINLLAAFYLDDGQYALTLDDFHTIRNMEILKSLPLILRRLPHSFVTLILSRTEPEEHFTHWMEQEQVTVFGPDELAFRSEEIKDYYISLGRTAGEAAAAFSFTGGWAIGVNVLAHSAVPAPNGYGGHVLERYIRQHIWMAWDDGLRAFMLASAAVEEMPVPLCEKITGRADAGQLLEKLRAGNIFVTRVEDGVYRYHHLFLDFLRARPEYAAQDNQKRCRAAAEYYMDKEELITARRYAYQSGDTKIMLATWDRFLVNRGHSFDEYLEYIRIISPETIPGLCESCPPFYASFAWMAFLDGDAGSFEKYVDRLRTHLPVIFMKYPRFGELAISMTVLDYRTSFASQIRQAALLPPIQIKGEALRASSMSLQMPFLHRSSRDYHELTDTRLYDKLKKTFGKLLKSHYELVMHDVGAGLALEQNRVNDALTEARSAMSKLTDTTVNEVRFAAHMHLAAVYYTLGKDAELSECISETERFVMEDAPFLRPNLLAFTARVKLWDGDVQAARKWLDHYFVNVSLTLTPYRLYQYFTTVRALAVLGDLEKAEDLAARLRQLGKDYRRPQDAAEAGALLAAVLWAAGRRREAQETLEAVLFEMQPSGFVRLVADEGAAVLPVLKKITVTSRQADYAGGLEPVYVNNVYLAAYGVSKRHAGIMAGLGDKPVKLSRQQKRIISLLAQGYKREDIMEITALSRNTVKTHIRLAYDKLGVNSAADAVTKARELGIIEQ